MKIFLLVLCVAILNVELGLACKCWIGTKKDALKTIVEDHPCSCFVRYSIATGAVLSVGLYKDVMPDGSDLIAGDKYAFCNEDMCNPWPDDSKRIFKSKN